MRVNDAISCGNFKDYLRFVNGKNLKLGGNRTFYIGIFWIVNGKVDGFRESIENGEDYGDTVQPSCDHFIYWGEFVLRYPELLMFNSALMGARNYSSTSTIVSSLCQRP